MTAAVSPKIYFLTIPAYRHLATITQNYRFFAFAHTAYFRFIHYNQYDAALLQLIVRYFIIWPGKRQEPKETAPSHFSSTGA
jgi:hypothetical protein